MWECPIASGNQIHTEHIICKNIYPVIFFFPVVSSQTKYFKCNKIQFLYFLFSFFQAFNDRFLLDCLLQQFTFVPLYTAVGHADWCGYLHFFKLKISLILEGSFLSMYVDQAKLKSHVGNTYLSTLFTIVQSGNNTDVFLQVNQ